MIYKTLHRKLNIEQDDTPLKRNRSIYDYYGFGNLVTTTGFTIDKSFRIPAIAHNLFLLGGLVCFITISK
jgi:hypothetical protein